VTLIGDGFGLAGCAGCAGWAAAGGLPLLMGTTSGMTCCCFGGGANTAPTTGVDVGFSVMGARSAPLGSDRDRTE